MRKVLFLLSLGLFLVLISSVRADCVVPTDFMEFSGYRNILCKGTYYLPHGLNIASDDTIVDCKGSVLVGDSSLNEIGFSTYNYNYVTIKNCEFRNYTFGINPGGNNNHFIGNKFININLGIVLHHNSGNIIIDNYFEDNIYSGIELTSSDDNLISDNYFNNSKLIFTQQAFGWPEPDRNVTTSFIPVNNKVYNNTFFVEGMYFLTHYELCLKCNFYMENYNEFCVNGIGNTYLDGATGPTCEDLPINKRVSLLELTVNNIWNKVLDLINDLKLLDERVDALEGVTTTTTTTKTTSSISGCSNKNYSACHLLTNCKWVGDMRIGHCESK